MSAPRHSVFISYRRRETAFAVDQLDRAVRQAFGDEAVFRDVRSIRKGQDFPGDIRTAISEARVGLVVIGPWWLTVSDDPKDPTSRRRIEDPTDWVRQEVESLLQRELAPGQPIPVIPLYTGGASAPGASDLPDTLKPLATRNGEKLDAYPATEHCIARIIEHLAKILGVKPEPAPSVSPVSPEKPPRFGGNGFTVTGKKFVGREQELHLLDEAWGRAGGDKRNVVSLIGQGGEGKSALVLEWQSRRARHGWQGARRVFEWSFYSQGTSAQSSASADDFFNAAFAWLESTEVPKDAFTKGAKLAELMATERTLLVLDGLEPLQQPPGGFGGEFKDPALTALLRGLARHNPGLCILTSRTDITDLSAFEGADGSCLSHRLDSLDPVAARALLRELGVVGPDTELDEASEWFHRHAYDLNLLGNYLGKCTTDHDIKGWQQRFPILREDEKIHDKPDESGKRVGHGRRMLRAYERWLEPPQEAAWRNRLPSWLGGTRPRRSPALAALRLLGLFDRPVRSDLLDELRADPVISGLTEPLVSLSDDEWLGILDQLHQLALIGRERMSVPGGYVEISEVNVSSADISDELVDTELRRTDLPQHIKNLPRTELKRLIAAGMEVEQGKWAKRAERPRRPVRYALDTHPLLREHFGADLREQHSAARREGHRRLYSYLCETTPDQPDATLEDLQPLYQAVAHGCQARLQQHACDQVYYARIVRGTDQYSFHRLGALGSDLGAIACFFEPPWSRVSPALTPADQAWLLNEAGYRLRALGRLTEATEPLRTSLANLATQGDWKRAAGAAVNLCELEMTLGDVAGAIRDGEQSVKYADRSGDEYQSMVTRSTHASALHVAGRRVDAEARFREAERKQAEWQPAYFLLYSMAGLLYCELLLSDAEREAGKADGGVKNEELLAVCHAISERATQTLKWAEQNNVAILDIAVNHLALGRTALFTAVLSSNRPSSFDLSTSHLEHAVSGLRRAGTQDILPRGLLSRAWLRGLTGPHTGPESAQSDLDEVWEVAERGRMPLFLADTHLYRARLFGSTQQSARMTEYPWESPSHDLAEARRLILKHGYLRRIGELEDAEAAISQRA